MTPPTTALTLSDEPQDLGIRKGRARLAYPTAQELRSVRRRARHGRSAADRLARLYAVEPNGCWRWLGSITTVGYGHFSIGGVYYQAHRLLYILTFEKDVPDGLFLDHLCRHRWCVNPGHLEPVTHQQNIRRGIGTHLTPETVVAIHEARHSGLSQRALGDLFGVDHSTICRVLKGERWPEYAPSPVESAVA